MRLFLLLFLCINTAHADWASAITEIRSEKPVKDVVHKDGQNIVYVGVANNKGNRDGYAAYLCEVISEHKVSPPGRTVDVYIVDYYAVMQKNDWSKIGKHYCRL